MISNNTFWENNIDSGYYDKILTEGLKKQKGTQTNWHYLTFKKIRKYILYDDKHLDYACGPGTFIGLFSPANSLGYDIDKKQILYAKSKYISIKSNFTNNLETVLKGGPYDVVTIIGLLEFLDSKETEKLFNTISKITRKNSKLILTTPNYNLFFKLALYFAKSFNLVDYSDVTKSMYTKSTLEKTLSLYFNDYKIEKILNFGVFLSFFSLRFAEKFEYIIEKIFKKRFGSIFLVSINT